MINGNEKTKIDEGNRQFIIGMSMILVGVAVLFIGLIVTKVLGFDHDIIVAIISVTSTLIGSGIRVLSDTQKRISLPEKMKVKTMQIEEE